MDFWVSIKTLAGVAAKMFSGSNDLSQEAALHLSLAYQDIKQLEKLGAVTQLDGRPLATPSIERAYREVMYIRSQLPAELLDDKIMTRYGRLNIESKIPRGSDGEPKN